MRRHSEGDVDQLSRRRGGRILRRGAGLVEDVEDFILTGANSGPSPLPSFCLVAAREGVGDVVGRRYPFEVGCPCLCGGQPPHGCHHAVDGAVVAIAFGQGALAGDVVDVSRPERREPGGEGGDGQDLCEDLEGIHKGPALREDVEEPRRGLAEVVEDLAADLHDVAPTIATALALAPASVIGDVSRLDPAAVVDEESVCEYGRLGRPGRAVWYKPWLDVIQPRCRREQCVDEFRRRVGVSPCRLRRPFVDGLDGSPSHCAEHGLGEEAELAGQALRRRWVEDAGVQNVPDDGLQLVDAALCGLDCHAVCAELDVNALYHLLLGRRLGFARLRLEAKVASRRGCRSPGVEVVHIGAAEQWDQRPDHHLDCVACPVEVPD